ncbi:MAG: hypothetical protein ED556_08155 [Winogradskyella sp.]|uniref:hypothetical protein n=1 Tax=Winogradskyella sp. TaxID=1883156 RepID=UPI000F40A889|nr:hypothetical protein [Winogradskyella sp.]RNC86260.1 MAG: hypothetical protein ED556_08155 [Winogradskyella sp.]
MWIKIDYKKEEFEYEIFKPDTISVSFEYSETAPLNNLDKSVRLSKIFPLVENSREIKIKNASLYFFDFENPYRVLGKISQKGSDNLRSNVYFSNGICSILLLDENRNLYDEFMAIVSVEPDSFENWEVENGLIKHVDFKLPEKQGLSVPEISPYDNLTKVEKVTLDEFVISMKILITKIETHDNYNLSTLSAIINEVNTFIKELQFLTYFVGDQPISLIEHDIDLLKDPLENQIMKQQILDRLIQINSSISYVSTQSYSGAIPILERRSLIRRNSLLGVGSTIRALNRLVEYIESAINKVDFKGILTEGIVDKATYLRGLGELPKYDSSDWSKLNLQTFNKKNGTNPNQKLAYFSSRLGFRETEYSITASINSITSGLSLEWSMMTITHEMLHSHVRLVLNSIFYGAENKTTEVNFDNFYETYLSYMLNRKLDDHSLIDSIRNVIFSYCCNTKYCGSLTTEMEYNPEGFKVEVPSKVNFWELFRNEYRNLNEIFVHVLDLHYFYGGRTSKYIPLIWCSWSAVPHINADIRQYILRSLLAIASKIDNNPYERWKLAVQKFRDILASNFPDESKFPIFTKLKEVIQNDEVLKNYYFNAFKNSLIIVDLVMKVFYSSNIRAKLLDDEHIIFERDETKQEEELVYNIEEGFYDLKIDCPIPFLFYSMTKILKGEYKINDIERETSLHFLAMNSKS